MSNISKLVFKLISESIVNDKPKDVTKYLNKLPLENIHPDRTDTYLNNILIQCLNLNRHKCCKAVMKRFFRLNLSEETFSTFCQMFSSMKFSERLLSFVMDSHPKESFLDLVSQYIENADTDENVIGMKRMDEVFGNQSLDTYEILFEAAYENEADSIAIYLAERVAELSPYINIPPWIKDFSTSSSSSNISPLTKTSRNVSKLQSLTISGDGDEKALLGDLPESTSNPTIESINNLPIETDFYIPWIYDNAEDIKESSDYIKSINDILRRKDVANTEHDINIFRILGPPNPPIRANIPLPSRNTVYDGPRMFICDQYDYDEDDILSDWFQGSCIQCLMRIRKRWYAVRKPKVGGGWIGSFCSFVCMRNSEEAENWLLMQMIDDLEKLMNEFGIQDRRSVSDNYRTL